MIQNPLAIVIFLLAIEIFILTVSRQERYKKYFSFLPHVFWIYFLPMLASTVGLIDAKSPVYQTITSRLLPASLLLLLISVDIKAILKLGRPALIMFFAGSIGIIFGAPIVYFLFKNVVGVETWSGFGALSASWTGGSANMIAVKEALGTPDRVFLPMVIVDTIVPYVWMGTLVAVAAGQPLFDRWNRSDRRILDMLGRKVAGVAAAAPQKIQPLMTVVIIAVAMAGSLFSTWIGKFLPVVPDVISHYAWSIIIVSILGLSLSLTPARKLESSGSTRIGYFLLYFVLTSIGAKANISHIGSTVILLLAGCMLVLIHATFLVFVARLIKAPMFLVAVASQANIGGVASAPIVAEIYQPGLASVGLLLAILGNVLGTYMGIVAGQLCRLVQ